MCTLKSDVKVAGAALGSIGPGSRVSRSFELSISSRLRDFEEAIATSPSRYYSSRCTQLPQKAQVGQTIRKASFRYLPTFIWLHIIRIKLLPSTGTNCALIIFGWIVNGRLLLHLQTRTSGGHQGKAYCVGANARGKSSSNLFLIIGLRSWVNQ